MIARAQQQRNATATQFDSLELFVCRLENQERTLSVLTEELCAQEITLIGYLHQLLQWHLERATMSLRGNCRRIREVYMDWFEESATQPIIMTTRNGEVGKPRFHVKFSTVHGQVLTVVF